jgi:hypothetical protein
MTCEAPQTTLSLVLSSCLNYHSVNCESIIRKVYPFPAYVLCYFQYIKFFYNFLCPLLKFVLIFLQGGKHDVAPVLRSLGLDDFIQSKAKVGNLKY